MISTGASLKEGSGFVEALLCRACIFSLCLRGFSTQAFKSNQVNFIYVVQYHKSRTLSLDKERNPVK